MSLDVTQRDATNSQSYADYSHSEFQLGNNWHISGTFKNNTGSELVLKRGVLAVRDAGTAQVATVVFSIALTTGQTVILGGLTYTSTGATTVNQLAAAFANLAAGATTGPGTATGSYSGTFTGFSTGAVINGNTVVFTSTTRGASTPLAQTGTGGAATITVVAGVAATTDGFLPATASNLADIVGAVIMRGSTTLSNGVTQWVTLVRSGRIDGNKLVLPSSVTLDTPVGNKVLKDVLNQLFDLDFTSVDLTKFDN